MDGQPSVFYRDYFGPEDKALPGELKTLTGLYNRFAVGKETVRLIDKSALVLEREQNLLACFNSGGADTSPRTVTVQTAWKPIPFCVLLPPPKFDPSGTPYKKSACVKFY